jgi:type I restriction enzyme, S subunit
MTAAIARDEKCPIVAIGDLALNDDGAFKIGPFGSTLKKVDLAKRGIPLAGIENVLPNRFIKKFRRFITAEKFNKLADYAIHKDDILVTMMGTIGRAAVAPGGLGQAIIDSHLFRMRVDVNRVLPEYLCYAINSDLIIRQLEREARGAIMLGLNTTILRKCSIPLPAISKQAAIVEVLTRADQLRSVRRLALQTCDELLPAAFLALFGDPVRNTGGWPSTELEELATVERGKFTPRPRNDPSYFGGAFPFIQTGDISESRGRLRTWTQTLNEKGIKVSRSFQPGTIVIAIVGATIGKTAILDIEVYCPDSVVGIRVDPEQATKEYIEFLLRFWRPIFLAQAPETARANINLDTLRPLRIPLPPLPLQKQFTRLADCLDRLRATHIEALRQAEHLFHTLLHRAFSSQQ